MYKVYGDDICIYNNRVLSESMKAIAPKLTMKDNTAGSLEITLPPTNAGYDILKRMASEIKVYSDDLEIWSGRIISEKKDFYNNQKLFCEGELAYLNDTTQPTKEYENVSILAFLTALLNEHNYIDGDPNKPRVNPDKRFAIGSVTVTGEVEGESDIAYCLTNNESTMEVIMNELVNRFGGHLQITKENGVRKLNYLKDFPNLNSQTVRFGQNLLDFTRDWDMSKIATVIIPRGARVDAPSGWPDELDAHLDVSGAEGGNYGSRYVTDKFDEDGETVISNQPLIDLYGWIEIVVDWPEIEDADELLKAARLYLTNISFEDMVIELSAIDLRYLGLSTESIKLLDKVICETKPHGLNAHDFSVTELTINLDAPDKSTYVLGSKITSSLTSTQKDVDKDILDTIKKVPSSVLDTARKNAAELINQHTNGYVTINKEIYEGGIRAESITISDTIPYTDGTAYWKWSEGGLGYFKRDSINDEWELPVTAMTKTGEIVADFIKTGTLSTVLIEDLNGNSSWNLSTGVFTMKQGSIDLGDGNFSVDSNGELYSTYGEIGGFTINSWRIYNSVLSLHDNGLDFIKVIDDVLHPVSGFTRQYWELKPNTDGLAMSLDPEGDYITWGVKDSSLDDIYMSKLIYTKTALPLMREDMHGPYDDLSEITIKQHDHVYLIRDPDDDINILYYRWDDSEGEFVFYGNTITSAIAPQYLSWYFEDSLNLGCPMNFGNWPLLTGYFDTYQNNKYLTYHMGATLIWRSGSTTTLETITLTTDTSTPRKYKVSIVNGLIVDPEELNSSGGEIRPPSGNGFIYNN